MTELEAFYRAAKAVLYSDERGQGVAGFWEAMEELRKLTEAHDERRSKTEGESDRD